RFRCPAPESPARWRGRRDGAWFARRDSWRGPARLYTGTRYILEGVMAWRQRDLGRPSRHRGKTGVNLRVTSAARYGLRAANLDMLSVRKEIARSSESQ